MNGVDKMRVIRFPADSKARRFVSGDKLFGMMFKLKQEVVIIDANDALYWGRIAKWDRSIQPIL